MTGERNGPDQMNGPGRVWGYLPLQQSGVQPLWQQSLHLLVQQEAQQALLVDFRVEVWA